MHYVTLLEYELFLVVLGFCCCLGFLWLRYMGFSLRWFFLL